MRGKGNFLEHLEHLEHNASEHFGRVLVSREPQVACRNCSS